MSYLTAVQVKNILAKAGIPRGKKSGALGSPENGVETYDAQNGWVMVDYSNADWATKDGIALKSHNRQMFPLIEFVLKTMNEFEHEVIEHTIDGHFKTVGHYFRKAK